MNLVQYLGSGDAISAWARYLGLATKPLFGADGNDSQHYALLNGRDASFACSSVADIDPDTSRSWQWSADLAHHVILLEDEVRVRSGRDEEMRRFSRRSVETRLEDFLAFLDSPKHAAFPDIVRHLLGEFEQIWALLPGAAERGHIALATFLTAIEAAGREEPSVFLDSSWRRDHAVSLGFEEDEVAEVAALPDEVAYRAVGLGSRTPLNLKVHSELVLRHTGGRLFQEAHGYLESIQPDLFGGASVTRVIRPSPTAAYFTPVPIARLVAEAAIQNYGPLPEQLVVADFACGSAVFLAEMLHVLERVGYAGEVTLVGRDISSEAIVMARVAIAAASRGIGTFRIRVDVDRRNALDPDAWVSADVILMNPPFRSWEQMIPEEKEWVRSSMGGVQKGRPDLSVGFIERAVGSLNERGVLATLLPAGLLAAESLSGWRHTLAEKAHPTLVAVLGEHGLFRHALVNIGVLVAVKGAAGPKEPLLVAWAAPEDGAASGALRALRRTMSGDTAVPEKFNRATWSITETTAEQWQRRPSWLPGPNLLGQLLATIQDRVRTTVEDLFHVRQGIRTGRKSIFVISAKEYAALPKAEQRFFAPAVENTSFVNGVIEPTTFVFVGSEEWESVENVQENVPRYYASKLRPAEDALKLRKGIDPNRWWRLTRGRSWMFDGTPRLVSKRFGLAPAFARDFAGKFAVLQANAWIPKRSLSKGSVDAKLENVLNLYWWLLNSNVAVAMFREYCPNVAGGQLDLENKYVKHVPLPDLRSRIIEDPSLQSLVARITAASPESLPPLEMRDEFAAACFGTSCKEWPL